MPECTEEERLFLDIAKIGLTCGLDSWVEWLDNYERYIGCYCSYKDAPDELERAYKAFTKVVGDCQYTEGDRDFTLDDLISMMNWHSKRLGRMLYFARVAGYR